MERQIIEINDMTFELGIKLIENRNYGIVTLENDNFKEEYIWYYMIETLTDLIEEIKEEFKN